MILCPSRHSMLWAPKYIRVNFLSLLFLFTNVRLNTRPTIELVVCGLIVVGWVDFLGSPLFCWCACSFGLSLVLWVCTPLFGHGKTMVISKRYWALLWFLCLVAVSVLTTQKYYYLKEFTEQRSQPPELIGVLSSPTHHGNATATAAISTSTSTATAEAETDNVFAPGSLTGMTRLETYERCYERKDDDDR